MGLAAAKGIPAIVPGFLALTLGKRGAVPASAFSIPWALLLASLRATAPLRYSSWACGQKAGDTRNKAESRAPDRQTGSLSGNVVPLARSASGSAIVGGYRLYTVRGAGHFADVREFECPDDAAALDLAKRLADGEAVELWDRGRFIARLGVTKAAPAA
jgi:hypothetical protein